MKIKTIVVAGLCALPFSVTADPADRVSIGDFLLTKGAATAPSSKLEVTVGSEVDFDSAAGGFSYQRVELDVPLAAPYHLNDCHALTLSAGYEATWLENDTFLGDMDLHDFRLKLRWMYRQPASKWAWMALLEPGLATDGKGISSDDFSINGQVGFRYGKSPELAWIGGLVFFHDSMETRIYPGVGFQWKPADGVLVRLSGPSFKASWQLHDDWILHAGVSSGGGTWNVRQGGADFDVKLRSYQAGLGVERRLAEKVWLGLWAGVTLANDLEIETSSGNRLFNQQADAGWFVRLGVRRIVW